MHVQKEEDRTLPFIELPSKLQKLAPDCLSESSGGSVTTDKLEKDKKRIQDTFDAAEKAFTELATLVRNSNHDLSEYPQYGAGHINCLLAILEGYKDECVAFLDGHRANLVQLEDVSEADEIQIMDDGQLRVSTRADLESDSSLLNPEAHPQPNQLGNGRPNTPILDRPNTDDSTGSSKTLTPIIKSCISSQATNPPLTVETTAATPGHFEFNPSTTLSISDAVNSIRTQSNANSRLSLATNPEQSQQTITVTVGSSISSQPVSRIAATFSGGFANTNSMTTGPDSIAQTLNNMAHATSSLSFAANTVIGQTTSTVTPSNTATVQSRSVGQPLSHTAATYNAENAHTNHMAAGLTQGYSILKETEARQAEAMSRSQKEMFSTLSSLLSADTTALEQRVQEWKPQIKRELAQSLHNQVELLERKLGELTSLRQCYLNTIATRYAIDSELNRTESILKSHGLMIGRVRRAIMQAEFSNTPSTAEASRPGPVTNFLQKLSLPSFSGQVAEYPSFKQRFRDLTENAGYPLSVIMEHLKVAMPKD